ncbi:MAG: hypothetical protein JOY66_16765 [Acetobacteraceae bacterium]|nr:hypothetical protein [Acetobacteraceae bacterium]
MAFVVAPDGSSVGAASASPASGSGTNTPVVDSSAPAGMDGSGGNASPPGGVQMSMGDFSGSAANTPTPSQASQSAMDNTSGPGVAAMPSDSAGTSGALPLHTGQASSS